MKILLVSATHEEILKDLFPHQTILITQIGMVNTTFALTKELMQNQYDFAINMGIAGSFKNDLIIGDTVEVVEDIISEIGYQEQNKIKDFKHFNLKKKFKNNPKTELKKVKSITVNTVHGEEDSISEIINRVNPDIESMEGAAFFMVCQKFKLPCLQIRTISNKIENRNKQNWKIELAIDNLNHSVKKILKIL